jgi:hypothetical protein
MQVRIPRCSTREEGLRTASREAGRAWRMIVGRVRSRTSDSHGMIDPDQAELLVKAVFDETVEVDIP